MSKIWGSLGGIKLIKWFEFEQGDNKTHACIVVTEWLVIITWLTDIIFFIFCKINGDKRSQELHLSTCIQLRMTQNIPPEKSWILDIYSVVTL